MVQRVESNNTKLDEFEAKVVSVELQEGIEGRKQYHFVLDPIGFTVGGATGKLHEWIPMSPKSTQEAVPQGSVMDRYLQQVEICLGKPARDASTVMAALNLMTGKKFRFMKMKLGKDFEGKKAKDYVTPVALLQ
jgi:hypothetical protein